jgi:hypothetical protein
MTRHPDNGVLILLLDGELDSGARAGVQAHLAGCRECHARFAAIETVSQDTETVYRSLSAPGRRGRPWGWWVASAAAAALVVAALWPARRAPGVEPLPPVARLVLPAVDLQPPVIKPVRAQRASPRARVVREFIPLPFSDQSLPLDGAPVVRMSLPVESLRLASFRVSGQVEGRHVLADVILGLDGLPRAIRFVE